MGVTDLSLIPLTDLLKEAMRRCPTFVVAYHEPNQDGGEGAGMVRWEGNQYTCYGLAQHLADVIAAELLTANEDVAPL